MPIADDRLELAAVDGNDRLWEQLELAAQLDEALALALQPPAGLDAVEVAVEVELERHRGVVGRPSSACRRRTLEARCRQIQCLDERVDDPDLVVFGDVVVQALLHQRHLLPILAFEESLHLITSKQRVASS
jgi:hypothetical protein